MTATAAPEGMTAEETRVEDRPPVTQVVEVIEEDVIQLPSEPAPVEEPPVQEPIKEEVQPEPAVEEPTHKSMVEELYSAQEQPSVMPEISMHHKSGKKPFMVWAIVTIIVALLTGSILFAVTKKGGGSMHSLFAHPTPTPVPTATPTPTPTPVAVDKTSFTIQVLNGGGTAGAATKMKTFLTGKGYKVSATGNTPNYTYTATEIHGKTNMTNAVTNLQADLKDTYTLGAVDTNLDASASADVQVIVGK